MAVQEGIMELAEARKPHEYYVEFGSVKWYERMTTFNEIVEMESTNMRQEGSRNYTKWK
jgi:hypothetical protein